MAIIQNHVHEVCQKEIEMDAFGVAFHSIYFRNNSHIINVIVFWSFKIQYMNQEIELYWILNVQNKKYFNNMTEAVQMNFLRHLLGITKLDKEKNQCIRQKTRAQNMLKEIK